MIMPLPNTRTSVADMDQLLQQSIRYAQEIMNTHSASWRMGNQENVMDVYIHLEAAYQHMRQVIAEIEKAYPA